VRGDPASVRSTGSDDHPDRHRSRIPPAFTRDRPGQTPAAVRRSNQVVDIDDVSLELDNQQGSPTRVPREDVDHASLAVDRVRDLGREDPVGHHVTEPARDELVEVRMAAVQHPVEVARSPARHQVHPDVEFAGNLLDRRHAQRANVAPLNPADR
jgi:hypothetical protein